MSSTTNDLHYIKHLELSNSAMAKQLKSIKVLSTDLSISFKSLLSPFANCQVDYEREILQLKFTGDGPWLLHKITISFNGRVTKTLSFSSSDSVVSTGLLNSIEFELSIADMNIMFYNRLPKVFTFDLVHEPLETECKEVFKTTFSLELQNFRQTEWQLKGQINFYHPKDEIIRFFDNDFEVADDAKEQDKEISISFDGFRRMKVLHLRYKDFGYCKMFQRMLNIEDLTVRKALDDLSMNNKLVESTSIGHHFVMYFEGKKLSDKLGFNHLVLTPMTVYESKASADELDKARIFNKIIKIDGSRMVFEKPRKAYINRNLEYRVELVENRIPIRLAHQAFDKITRLKLEEFFTTFDESTLRDQKKKEFGAAVDEIDPVNPSVGTNLRQMEAVKNIVNRSSFPSPYVIFGPPGTGKTSTLVEAIAQIVKLYPSAKILVTANSNAACDEIGERLLKQMSRYKMYRLYSPSFDISFPDRHARLNPSMKPISNMKFDTNQYPSYEEFYSYSVVISTLVNCGRMICANVRSNHFDFIFIDECASTVEPNSIIPIVSLGSSVGCINAQIVLAGDHKQLQGMVHSYFNEKHGFGISLMERVMMLDKYQFPYNSRFVTQLTDNFRSHWAILKFSNYHFYHSVLRAKQSKEIADFAIGWDLLPNKNFPLVFHSILAASEMDGTSLFNDEEVRVVERYVNALLRAGVNGKKIQPTDIGIICPYGAQRKKLQEKFRFVTDLEIGTVDAFQGREKLIIIVSTVRSQTPTVGFLKNEKRLNVALTRAKALLIVIGNGETLQKNKLWYKFLNYCFQNDAMIGERFMLRYRKPAEGAEAVQKPHPIFQRPKVPITIKDSESESGEDSEVDSVVSEDDWISDSTCGSDSDVSWTHEDFRMKAKTSKIKKWKKVSTLIPKIQISKPQKRPELDTSFVKRFSQMSFKDYDGEHRIDPNNNNNLEEISSTWKSLKLMIRGIQHTFGELISTIPRNDY